VNKGVKPERVEPPTLEQTIESPPKAIPDPIPTTPEVVTVTVKGRRFQLPKEVAVRLNDQLLDHAYTKTQEDLEEIKRGQDPILEFLKKNKLAPQADEMKSWMKNANARITDLNPFLSNIHGYDLDEVAQFLTDPEQAAAHGIPPFPEDISARRAIEDSLTRHLQTKGGKKVSEQDLFSDWTSKLVQTSETFQKHSAEFKELPKELQQKASESLLAGRAQDLVDIISYARGEKGEGGEAPGLWKDLVAKADAEIEKLKNSDETKLRAGLSSDDMKLTAAYTIKALDWMLEKGKTFKDWLEKLKSEDPAGYIKIRPFEDELRRQVLNRRPSATFHKKANEISENIKKASQILLQTGQAEVIQKTGTISPEIKEEIRKLARVPDEEIYKFQVSMEKVDQTRRVAVDSLKQVAELEKLLQEIEDPIEKGVGKNVLELATNSLNGIVDQALKTRRASSRSLAQYKKAPPDRMAVEAVQASASEKLKEIANKLDVIPIIKTKLPILSQIYADNAEFWKIGKKLEKEAREALSESQIADLKKKRTALLLRTGKNLLNIRRLGLIPITSFSLDLVTNPGEIALQTIAAAGHDLFYNLRAPFLGRPHGIPALRGMQRAATELAPKWAGTQTKLGSGRTYNLPPEVQDKLDETAFGERFRQGRDWGAYTKRETKGTAATDYALGTSLYLKAAVDTTSGNIAASADLYKKAEIIATSEGLSGEAKQKRVDNLWANPTPEMVDSAALTGQKAKFNVPLSKFEKAFAGNVMVQTFLDAFPRFGFELARWVGRSVGADPKLWFKLKNGKATPEDFAGYLARTFAGWGALYYVATSKDDEGKTWYDRFDEKSGQFTKKDGTPIRAQGRTPWAEAISLIALGKGDFDKFYKALAHTSLPGKAIPQVIGGNEVDTTGTVSGGQFLSLLAPLVKGSASKDWERPWEDISQWVNQTIPAQSALSFFEALIDPQGRKGLGANIPLISELVAKPRIRATTGKPEVLKQEIFGATLPTAYAAIPGASILVGDIDKLVNLIDLEVPSTKRIKFYRGPQQSALRLEWKKMPTKYRDEARAIAGQELNKLLTPNLPELKKLVKIGNAEAARKWVNRVINYSGKIASAEILDKYRVEAEFVEKEE